MKMTILMAICFTWNIEKTHKKRMIVSRETLYIYAYLRIIIQIKGIQFCGIPSHKLYTKYIIVHMYARMIVYKYTSIRVFVYTCILLALNTSDC